MSDQTDALLAGILQRLNSDEYESLGLYTIGGPPGNYQLRSPVNTEVEYLVVGAYLATTTSNANGEVTATLLTNNQTSNANFTSADIPVGQYTVLDLDIVFTSFTGGTSPSITYNLARKDSFGNYNIIWSSGAKTAAFTTSLSVGIGAAAGSAPAANDATVGVDFGDTVQVSWTIAGAPTSITQATTLKGKGPFVSAAPQGMVVVTNNNPITNFSLGQSLGASSAGSDMNNALEGVVLPTTSTINSLIAVDYWMPTGRGANIYVLVTGTASYALIAVRRKLERYIPVRQRAYPHTHSHPAPRRWERILPAESTQVAGFESQYPAPGGKPYQHQPGPSVDPGWQRRGGR